MLKKCPNYTVPDPDEPTDHEFHEKDPDHTLSCYGCIYLDYYQHEGWYCKEDCSLDEVPYPYSCRNEKDNYEKVG